MSSCCPTLHTGELCHGTSLWRNQILQSVTCFFAEEKRWICQVRNGLEVFFSHDEIAQEKISVELVLGKLTATIRARYRGRHGLVYLKHGTKLALQRYFTILTNCTLVTFHFKACIREDLLNCRSLTLRKYLFCPPFGLSAATHAKVETADGPSHLTESSFWSIPTLQSQLQSRAGLACQISFAMTACSRVGSCGNSECTALLGNLPSIIVRSCMDIALLWRYRGEKSDWFL